MQIQSLNSFPPAPSAAPVRTQEQEVVARDVIELGQPGPAPSLETTQKSDVSAPAVSVAEPAPARPAATAVPTVLIQTEEPASAPAPGINLQAAVQQAAAGSNLSESAKAEVVSKLEDDLGENPDPHNVAERVSKIVQEKLNVEAEQVTPEASYADDLGADSLDTVELVLGYQEEFGIEIPEEEVANQVTVGDTIEYIKDALKDTPPPEL